MSAAQCISSANDLLAAHSALINRVRQTQKAHRRQLRALASPPHDILNIPLIPSPLPSPPLSRSPSPSLPPKPKPFRADLPPAKRARVARYENYVPEEETIRNDYSARYVDTGEWPQNWVLGADPDHRFEEYPKQQRLLALKKASVAAHALPPSYLPYAELSSLHPSKFDVILIDPPFSSSFTWDDLLELPIPALAADPAYVFLWVGSGAGDGLERGREVVAKWGFRRCEDIVWVKTNKSTNHGPGTDPPTTSLLTRTKQHCLMGIRGTVRRSTDSWFVHCNVDTDVIIWEGDPTDPTLKPPEMYTLIENFCLGLRRLELFGRARTLRKGWVSALAEGEETIVHSLEGEDQHMDGDTETPVRWDRESWEAKNRAFASEAGGKIVVPMTSEIDALRPKSPVRGGQNNQSGPPPQNGPSGASGMAAPMSMGRGSFNNPPPRMMGPPIMMGGVNQMGGMGTEAMGLGIQNMHNMQNHWGDSGMGGMASPMPGGGMGMGMGGGGQGMGMGGGAQSMGMGGISGLGNLGNLGNLANLSPMAGNMGGMAMGNMGQYQGGGGYDGGAMQSMQGMGGWEGQEMMGMGVGMGGMGMQGMGMNNAMGLNGMNGMNGMSPGMAMNPTMNMNMNMNNGMGMGGGGMNMGGGMGNMGMGMGMNQWNTGRR